MRRRPDLVNPDAFDRRRAWLLSGGDGQVDPVDAHVFELVVHEGREGTHDILGRHDGRRGPGEDVLEDHMWMVPQTGRSLDDIGRRAQLALV
jgi:hypothetical protein